MEQAIIAVGGSVLALFLYSIYTKYSADKGQVKLKDKVEKLETKAEEILAGVQGKDKETQEKVDEVTKEQDKPITSSELVDFFSDRNSSGK
jgi:hypothetical protein